MKRLRSRMILVFVAATTVPLLMTAWVWLSLLNHSLALNASDELDRTSKALEQSGRELYQRARAALQQDAESGRIQPRSWPVSQQSGWPAPIIEFWSSGEDNRFALSGDGGSTLDYMVRHDGAVSVYSADLHVPMQSFQADYTSARTTVGAIQARNLRRGFTITFVLLSTGIWLLALGVLIYFAQKISKPIQQLTAGLSEVAAGNLDYHVAAQSEDEIGTAIRAFNGMTTQLRDSRDQLVYMARLESWQALARKMAHEIKNTLTPIRLTVEEMAARSRGADRAFLDQAKQIVVDEVLSLERRVRAFSELGSDPAIVRKPLDINLVLEERVSLLKAAHPEVVYNTRLAEEHPEVYADEDLVKGLLTNLLENAAQAVEPGGVVLGVTARVNGHVAIEIHDSGPGLNREARRTLFEPTISFKPGGMGLGLSIARKSAVLSGGDIQLFESELGGAGFRVLLPAKAFRSSTLREPVIP